MSWEAHYIMVPTCAHVAQMMIPESHLSESGEIFHAMSAEKETPGFQNVFPETELEEMRKLKSMGMCDGSEEQLPMK
jgi:hypothetical protein